MAATATAGVPVHVAFLPTPGIGHLIPLAEFARNLHHRHDISATFIIPTDGHLSRPQKALLATLPPAVDYLLLPSVNFDDPSPDVRAETRIALTVARSLPFIRAALESLLADQSKRFAALVVDLFGADAFDVARELGIPPYIFFPSTATCLSLFLHLPELDETVKSEYKDASEPFRLPGCVPFHGRDLVDPLQDRKNDAYKWILYYARKYPTAEGIILNSFKQIEPGPIESLQIHKMQIYPIGPLTHSPTISNQISESNNCLEWLAQQPMNSVVYISFGSGGSLSRNQIVELASGLEMSEERFLWVLRCPNDKSPSAAYFSIHDSEDPLSYLPEGFLERTKGRGLVVPSWAPQVAILAEGSVGGFVTHCGWNSTLESVVNGVPVILWPLYAEQRMNAVMLEEEIGVGLRVSSGGGEGGVVGREEVARVVRELMEGEEGKRVRNRVRELKKCAKEAAAGGGIGKGDSTSAASEVAWDELVERWKTKIEQEQ